MNYIFEPERPKRGAENDANIRRSAFESVDNVTSFTDCSFSWAVNQVLRGMWTPSATSVAPATPPSNVEPSWVRWSGAPRPTNPTPTIAPIPVQDDGSLELDISKQPAVRRIAPVPLHISKSRRYEPERGKTSEQDQIRQCQMSKQGVRIYISQQGHTVKMARLGDPSLTQTNVSKAPLKWKEDLKGSGGSSPKSLASSSQSRGIFKGKRRMASSDNSNTLEENVITVNNPSKCDQSDDIVGSGMEISAKGLVKSKNLHQSLTTERCGKDTKDSNVKTADCEHEQKTPVTEEQTPEYVIQDPLTRSKPNATVRQPSVIKMELDDGLNRIMADLAALRVISTETGDSGSVSDNKERAQKKNGLDVDESKENNLPCKRSRNSYSECSDGSVSKYTKHSAAIKDEAYSPKNSHTSCVSMSRRYESKKSSTSSLHSSLKRASSQDGIIRTCDSREKRRSYDPEKAREFIRQQKHERMDRLRAERERKKADIEARKQKLRELSETSLKLVQASIKKKTSQCSFNVESNIPASMQNQSEEIKQPLGNSTFNLNIRENTVTRIPDVKTEKSLQLEKGGSSIHQNGGIISPGPNLVSTAIPDVSNAQLIRDINDMKAKIEMMAKSLKSTIEANKVDVVPGVVMRAPHQSKPPISVQLGEWSELMFGPITLSDPQSENGQVPNNSEGPSSLLQITGDYMDLNNLTSNLRKMRKSLRSVLSQEEVKIGAEPKTLQNRPRELKRFHKFSRSKLVSSRQALQHVTKPLAKPDSSEVIDECSDSNQLPDIDESQITPHQKKKITTSFPTLPLPSMDQPIRRSRASSETDISVKTFGPNFHDERLEPSQHSVSHQPLRTNLQQYCNVSPRSDHLEITGGPLEVASEQHTPEWLEPLTQEPYPVNFISAVKRKLNNTLRVSIPPEPQPSLPFSNSVPQDLTTSLKLKGQGGSSMPELVSNLLQSASNLEVPVFPAPSSNMCSAEPSAHQKPGIKLSTPGLVSNGVYPSAQGSYLRPFPPAEERPFRTSHEVQGPFDLQKMSAEFTSALNPGASKVGAITPAEKPLSAPNTPAKNTDVAHKSSQAHRNEGSEVLNPLNAKTTDEWSSIDVIPMEEVDPTSAPPVTDGDTSIDLQTIESEEVSEASKREINKLVPPDVKLLMGRVNRKEGAVDKWVSHRRGNQEELIGEDIVLNGLKEQQESSKHSSLQSETQTSSRDTFEIGRIFNPTALHLQFQAELNILDSFNESLCQVMEVEKVRAVALARHQALGESLNHRVQKEDKATDAQASLEVTNSEVSTINYVRGSGNPGDISLLTKGVLSDKNDQSSSAKKEVSSSQSSVQNGGTSSPSSTTVSGSLSSSVKEKPSDTAHVDSASPTSIEKSVSEVIDTGSGSVPEQISLSSVPIDLKENLPAKEEPVRSNRKVQTDSSDASTVVKEPGTEALHVDVSLNSHSDPSTFTGGDALIVESLACNEHHILPTLGSGEDAYDFTLQMLEQLMYEEKLRIQHKSELLKLRQKALADLARAEIAALNLDKKRLRGIEGNEDQISALRKKQRGIMIRFQQQRDEMERIRRTDDLAWEERRMMYLRQIQLVRMQRCTKVVFHKVKKNSAGISQKSEVLIRSIQDPKASKTTRKTAGGVLNNFPLEASVELALPQSKSVSLASLISDGSRSSAISSVNRHVAGAGDSESSHLEDRVLRGFHELEGRRRQLTERETALHECRESVEKLIQWRRHLEEEEEHRLKEVEKQAHSRHRPSHPKRAFRDRSTSPFQFPESGNHGGVHSLNGSNGGRTLSEIMRNGRNGVTPGCGSVSGSVSASASIPEEVDSSMPEEISDHFNKPSSTSTLDVTNADPYTNESFESEMSEVKTVESLSAVLSTPHSASDVKSVQTVTKNDSDGDVKSQPRLSERSNKYPGVTIKVPLSPRLQRVQRRRYSSGSDDSMVLSQTETGSEQSDIEGRISALTEQLEQRKAEAERLRKEAKRTRNERLIAKEQSLHKQLQAYEVYIAQARQNLDAELNQSSVPIVRPQIKQPRVASGKVATRRQDASQTSVPGSDRSTPPTSNSDATNMSPRKEDAELEFKETNEALSEAISTVASEVPSEVASEPASEVPSDVASELTSEISENSLLSNDAPSLVVNKPVVKATVTAKVDDVTSEAFSDVASETGSEVMCNVHLEDLNAGNEIQSSPPLKIMGEVKSTMASHSHEEIETEAGSQDESSFKKNDDTSQEEPLPSIVSEEEDIEDISDVLDDEHDLDGESEKDSGMIRVVFREKEKEDTNLTSEPIKEEHCLIEVKQTCDALVDRLADHILEGLLTDCLQPVAKKHSPIPASEHSSNIDSVRDSLFTTSLQEATCEILHIYKRKIQLSSTTPPTQSRTCDVRKRVNEILAEANSQSTFRGEARIREMMITTYGVLSPDDSPCTSPNLGSPMQQTGPNFHHVEDSDMTYDKMAETSAMKNDANKTPNMTMGLEGENAVDNEGVSQEWFDEDFGLTRSRREAEELRLQQLQIEQEIQQLQQQQAQVQEQIPYYYVREIPNKPPPPYTPPGQAPRLLASSSPRSPPIEEIQAVATDRTSIIKAVRSATEILFVAHSEKRDLASVQAPESFLNTGFDLPQPTHLSQQDQAIEQNSARVYHLFLFDLAKELVQDAYSCEQEDPSPPWLRPENWVRRRKALAGVPKTREALLDVVTKQTLVLFGFVPKASKENLTIRWSRKKRDHVDELLVRESQEEERQWTNYEQDEAMVKNNVTLAILNLLLDDTVQVVADVYRRREQRHQCSVY